jgi:hypothetical protein
MQHPFLSELFEESDIQKNKSEPVSYYDFEFE